MMEGWGFNVGICFINLEFWLKWDKNVYEIMEEFEEEIKDFGVIIEYFELLVVFGFGFFGGFFFCLLDKINFIDYQEFDEIN